MTSSPLGGSPLGGACPCGGPSYDACCGPLHRGERDALTAEELMRARYSAYACGVDAYVLRTWHPRTRPEELAGSEGLTWAGLRIVSTEAGGPDDPEGVVEFEASYRTGEGVGRLHERSRFTRRAGRWVYLDGEVG